MDGGASHRHWTGVKHLWIMPGNDSGAGIAERTLLAARRDSSEGVATASM